MASVLNFLFARDFLGRGPGLQKIKDIMEREEGFALRDLLMEEETLNQCKQQNKELLAYMCKRETIQELLSYAVEFPRDQSDNDAVQRFPFYSANILACGSDELAKALLKGGIVEVPKSEEETPQLPEGETPSQNQEEESKGEQQEKRELRIDDLNLDIGDGTTAEMEENKQGAGEQSKSRNRGGDSDTSDDVGEEGSLNSAQLTQKLMNQNQEPAMAQDFKLLDQLFDFVHGDQQLPILAGYYFKIANFLLGKYRKELLHYLIIERKKKHIWAMLDLLNFDSVSKFIVELLNVDPETLKTQKNNNQIDDMEEEEAKEEIKDEEDANEQELIEQIPIIQAQLMQKLAQRLDGSNRNFEQVLNAQNILIDLVEEKHCFQLFITSGLLDYLVQLMTDPYNENVAYIYKLFRTFIKSFEFFMGQIDQEKFKLVSEFVVRNFVNVVYNTMLVLKTYDGQNLETQGGYFIRPLGLKKLRALEFLQGLLGTKNRITQMQHNMLKQMEQDQNLPEGSIPLPPEILTATLRKNLVATMIYVMDFHGQSSISNQLCVQVLELLQGFFDAQDILTLQEFVKRQVNFDSVIRFDSGRETSQTNLGSILLLGFELKKKTEEMNPSQANLDLDEESGEAEDPEREWRFFCENELQPIQNTWRRKLFEEKKKESKEDISDSESEIQNQKLQMLLNRAKQNIMQKKQKEAKLSESKELQQQIDELQNEDKDFHANTFWAKPQLYNEEDLLAELDDFE